MEVGLGLVGWGFVGWGDGGRQNVRDSHSRGSVADDGLEVEAEVSLHEGISLWAGGRKAVNIYGFLSVKKLPGWHPTCAHPLLAQAAALLKMARYSSARKVAQTRRGRGGGDFLAWNPAPE